MWRNNFWEWWGQYGVYVLGPVLIATGWVLSHYVESRYPTRFMEELVIALVIAGILMVTVDPFIKKRARREATNDIFHHMLGFSLPPIIRERLQEIVGKTKFYRRDTVMHIVLSEDGESAVFDVEMEFEVVNPTPHDLCLQPWLYFEKGEQATLKSVACFEELDRGQNAKLSPVVEGLGSVEYRGKAVKIPSGGGARRFKYEYIVKYPIATGFWYPNFGLPTIGLSVTIKHPENFKVRATPDDYGVVGEWRYPNKLFMPNEHLDIVWEKTAAQLQKTGSMPNS